MPLLSGITSFQPITPKSLLKFKNSHPAIATMIPSNPEVISQPLYDRVTYPQAGTTSLAFFSTPKGNSATLITSGSAGTRTKDYRDTNMDQQGMMSSKGFIMYGVEVGYVPMSVGPEIVTDGAAAHAGLNFESDVFKIASGGYLDITFVDKPYLRIPIIALPSPFASHNAVGMAASTAIAADGALLVRNAGGYGPGNLMSPFVVDPPYLISPGEDFSVTMKLDGTALSTGNNVDIYVFLVGYMIRPSQ
jgi:hypothetical protein